MHISEFRIYKIDNTKVLSKVTDEIILGLLKASLKKEFDIPTEPIKFKEFQKGSNIFIFTFSGLRVDSTHQGPKWYNFLKLIGDEEKMKSLQEKFLDVQTSILSVIKISGNYYIIAFGNGFHSLPTTILDENFGINLSKKIITKNGKIKGISQSVIKGDLESTYKGLKAGNQYQPMLDSSNLGKKTRGIKGTGNSQSFFFDDEELKKLRLGLEGKVGIKIHVGNIIGLDSQLFTKIIKKINYFHNTDIVDTYKIPDLEKISLESTIIPGIKNVIITNILNKTGNVYFSPYLFKEKIFAGNTSYDVLELTIQESENIFKYDKSNYGDFESLDILGILESKLNMNNLHTIRIANLKYVDLEGEEHTSKREFNFESFLQGDIEYENNIYFFEGQDFYKPNDDFRGLVDTLFQEKNESLIISEKDFLHDWSINTSISIGKYEEEKYNRAHDITLEPTQGKSTHFCFDKGVTPTYGLDGIELCDILIRNIADELYFVHVKKAHGADLRELFSQGRVSVQHMLKDASKTAKHIKDKQPKLTINSAKIKNKNFTIVYAIKNPKTTDPFTLYAKYDFISTIDYFRSIGIENIKIYYIK